ncbi:hypothetical protein Dsin_027801 [Dipteronia sinensis]|uniref:Uncharacterized protein n=1 Tax=Dipteronia sinensis TaxID=43782 RepID=A0AAD9ZQ33_9ROSI|nr:hypothetical protein Dsin_027801 [Dipteronia sinensis]
MRMHNSAMNFRNLFVFLRYMLTIRMISCATNWDLWEHCYDTGNFTANSTYATNRNLLVSSLASNITVLNSGFYNTTIGQEPDKVYGLALCRGDVSSEDCSSCVNSTSQDIMSTCHSTKEALMWAGDPPCLVHYADRSLFGKVEMYVPINRYYRGNNLTMNLTEFDKIWQPLMERTMREASSGSSEIKFATQEANLTSIQTIYALMQCTPDLSQSDCFYCLTRYLDEYKKCCHGRQGGGVESPNCMLRWDLSLFYKDMVLPPLLSPPPAPTTMAEDNGGIAAGTVVIIIVSVIIFMLLVSLCCFFLGKLKQKQIRNNQGRKYSIHHCLVPFVKGEKEMTNTESLQFNIGTIRTATENFSEAKKLGQGGFGPVYKGTLPNGQQVAVKRLSMNSRQGEVEFKNEVTLLAKLQHRNLVRLLGFCLERKERILVYEFLPNSSLDHFIFDPIKREDLDWERRYKIIEGIARGLLYLHEDSKLRIIHCDLKASNILLDSKMNPKISDFGMARLFEMDQTHIITNRVVGTLGYMAPEYVIHRHFSVKSDVFSFGVLVLELVSGQKRSCFDTEEEIECLLTHAWKKWDEGTASNLIDPTLKEGSRNEMTKCIHIGLLCVQESISDRPTITSVIHMLNSNSVTLPSPAKPGFFMQSSVIVNASSSTLELNSTGSTESDQRRIATAPL